MCGSCVYGERLEGAGFPDHGFPSPQLLRESPREPLRLLLARGCCGGRRNCLARRLLRTYTVKANSPQSHLARTPTRDPPLGFYQGHALSKRRVRLSATVRIKPFCVATRRAPSGVKEFCSLATSAPCRLRHGGLGVPRKALPLGVGNFLDISVLHGRNSNRKGSCKRPRRCLHRSPSMAVHIRVGRFADGKNGVGSRPLRGKRT